MESSVADSYAHCQELARRTAGNFYYSFLTLDRNRRRAMCALYAFMRITDDLGDSEAPAETRALQLSAWRTSLTEACESGACDHPVLPAVADMLRQYQVPRQYLLEVIDGVEMDLTPAHYANFADLERYCYHVAGAVGLSCIHLWGFHDPRAVALAVDCGTAFQLTNILRDLGEDARNGRTYLPAEDLDRFQLQSAEFAGPASHQLPGDPRFVGLMEFEVARTREYYARARQLLQYLEPPGQPILQSMLRIYGGLLDEVVRRRYDVFSCRVSLSRSRKLWIAADVLLRHHSRRLFSR